VRRPLFVYLSAARKNIHVPDELRHSGILSLQWLIENKRGEVWPLYFIQPPNGPEIIDTMVDRIMRGKWPAIGQTIAYLRERISESIYEASSQVGLYRGRHVLPLLARNVEHGQNLYTEGSRCAYDLGYGRKVIAIKAAPKLPCRWCGTLVFYKESWLRGQVFGTSGTVRCNGPDCRRMDYLQYIPQSRGGIDLKPDQRKALSPEAWPTQRALNYLELRAKEIKRASRTSHDLRRRAPDHRPDHRGPA